MAELCRLQGDCGGGVGFESPFWKGLTMMLLKMIDVGLDIARGSWDGPFIVILRELCCS